MLVQSNSMNITFRIIHQLLKIRHMKFSPTIIPFVSSKLDSCTLGTTKITFFIYDVIQIHNANFTPWLTVTILVFCSWHTNATAVKAMNGFDYLESNVNTKSFRFYFEYLSNLIRYIIEEPACIA